MELSKKTMQRILTIIIVSLLLYWGLNHTQQVGVLLSSFTSLLAPFFIGACIAFVMNLLLRPLERAWDKLWQKRKGEWPARLRRPVCLVLSVGVLLGAIFAIFFVVIPELKRTIASFVEMLPTYLVQLEGWWQAITKFFANYGVQLPELQFDPEEAVNVLREIWAERGHAVVNKTVDITLSVVSSVANLLIAFVFSLYVLAQKEKLCGQMKKLVRVILSEERAKRVFSVVDLVNRTFTNFVAGQMTEAVIIGMLCFIGMLILSMPYALVVSVLVGFTALIPVFGAFIGTAIGAFLILLVSPAKAFWFIVFIIVLQQLEGNLIYPRVVGKSVGLPGIWVLAAVTVGGGTFGVLGMLLSVPICSVVYTLLTQFVHQKTQVQQSDNAEEDVLLGLSDGAPGNEESG